MLRNLNISKIVSVRLKALLALASDNVRRVERRLVKPRRGESLFRVLISPRRGFAGMAQIRFDGRCPSLLITRLSASALVKYFKLCNMN